MSYKWQTEMMEYFWKDMPEELKQEPFYMFYAGMIITKLFENPLNTINRN